MTRAFLVSVACLAGCGGWTKTDTLLEISAQATLAADAYQTQRGIDLGMTEHNPVIGDHGQNVAPAVYFPIVGVLHVAVAAALPPVARKLFQGATIAIEARTIWNNREQIAEQEAVRR